MKYKKIGDVCTILSGYAFDSKQFSNDPRDFPLIRIRDIVRGRTETYTKEKFDEKYIVKKGEFLIGMDGEFNIAPWNSQEALLNQRVCKIWCSSDEVIDNYLLYFLPKALKDIESKTSFVTVKHLSVKGINQIGIPLPPLEIQQRIAAILDTAAALLKLRQQQLAELEALIQSVFYQMFGDPVRNEKGWDYVKLSNLGTLNRGMSKHRPRNDPKLLNGEYPLIQTGDVANADFEIKEYSQSYSELGLKQSKMWSKGTLCITIAANIAKTAIMGFDACFPDSVVGFNANEKTNNIFIYCWFGFFQKILEEQAPESAQKNINLRILNDLDVILPPKELQTQFAAIVQKIEQQKALVQQSIDETQTLFDSLMSQYFD